MNKLGAYCQSAIQWIHNRLSKVSLAGVVLILWGIIPDTISRWSVWRNSVPTMKKLFAFTLTQEGRLVLVIVGLLLIALGASGWLRPKYNLKTLRGRTLSFRDEVSQYLTKLPPKPQFGTVTSSHAQELVKWSERLRCGFRLHFAERLDQLLLEYGERGLYPGVYVRDETYTHQRLQEIISDLEKLANVSSENKI